VGAGLLRLIADSTAIKRYSVFSKPKIKKIVEEVELPT
jgi:hypothetical protein